MRTVSIGLMKCGRAKCKEAEAARKYFNIVLTRQDKKFFISELFKVIQEAITQFYTQDNVLLPDNFFESIYHIGCAISLHSITNSGLILGGQNPGRERQPVFFFTVVNPMDKDHKDPYKLDLTEPRFAWYKQKTWKRHQDTVHWVDMQLAQRKGLNIKQDRTQSSFTTHSQLICIRKVVVMESGEI